MISVKSWLYLVLIAGIINGLPLSGFCQEVIHEVKVSPSQVGVTHPAIGQPRLQNDHPADTINKVQYLTYSRSSAPAGTPVLISSMPMPADSSGQAVNQVVVAGGAKAPATHIAPQPVEPLLSPK
jgi:hypothetical protein